LVLLQEIRSVQAAFNGVMIHDPELTNEVYQSVYDQLTKVFLDHSNKDTFEFGIKHIIVVAGSHKNEENVDVIINFLEKLIANSITPAR